MLALNFLALSEGEPPPLSPHRKKKLEETLSVCEVQVRRGGETFSLKGGRASTNTSSAKLQHAGVYSNRKLDAGGSNVGKPGQLDLILKFSRRDQQAADWSSESIC